MIIKMQVLLIIVSILNIAAFALSYKKYDEFVIPLNKKEYPLKEIIPMGIYVIHKIEYKFDSKYDMKIASKIGELTGHRYVSFYQIIHLANKISLMLLELLLICIVGISIEVDEYFLFFAIALLVGSFFLLDKELENRIKIRKTTLKIDFPEFVNTLVLLVNSGMPISRAWEKATNDSNDESLSTKDLHNILTVELQMVLADIRGGKSEIQAYEDFAKRCRVPEITKFVSVIIQNLKKGNSELVSVLRLISNECWEMRKNTARRLGEEASTKLLLPMMITFLAILIIVILPAIMSMQGII